MISHICYKVKWWPRKKKRFHAFSHVLQVQIHPPRTFLEFFAKQRTAKSTPAFLTVFGHGKQKKGLRRSRSTAPKPYFAWFYPIFAQNAEKNAFCRGRQKTFLFWRSGRDLNPRAAFDGNTISSRARYDHFDTTAYFIMLRATADVIIPNRRRLSSIYRHFLRENSFEWIPKVNSTVEMEMEFSLGRSWW